MSLRVFVHVSFEHFHLFLYLTLFITILNGTFSYLMLFVYVSVTGFCMFILYLAPMLSYFVF